MFDAVQLRTDAFILSFVSYRSAKHGADSGRDAELAPTPTIPAAAAEQGKDVVHQLNNAFAKVFETVAPSVVIIEISKKNDSETSAFEDLFLSRSAG